ncbi:hypothetical protein IHE45_12G023400 [Dioscorea alata]|uniref:Uncharacterized protein n=1 Tax=Dioscorea alata TaxID=55571 RepID=A0ACB7V0M1_DIOAL|nr:hypothetical protein IHE45_12G023400 [Dioscorea alata]
MTPVLISLLIHPLTALTLCPHLPRYMAFNGRSPNEGSYLSMREAQMKLVQHLLFSCSFSIFFIFPHFFLIHLGCL